MTEKRPPAAEPGRPARSRWRWALHVVLSLAAGLVAFLILLPTIITILPLERLVSSQINQRLNGTVIIGDFSLGWIRSVRLENLIVYTGEPTEENLLLRLEEFDSGAGLVKLALSQERIANVSLGRIETIVRRDAEGIFNFAALVPEGSEAKPVEEEEETGEPLRLELAELLPRVPVPLSSIGIRVREIRVVYTDAALTPPADIALEDSRFSLTWAGAEEPLAIDFQSKIVGNARQFTLEKNVRLSDWIREGTTDFSQAQLDVVAVLTTPEGETRESRTALRIDNELITLESTINLTQFPELATVYLSPDDLPRVEGDLGITARADFSDNTDLSAAVSLQTQTISVDGAALPDLLVAAEAAIDKETYDRDEVSLLVDSTLLELRVTETPDGSERALSASFSMEPRHAIDAAQAFVFDTLPTIRGELAFDADLRHNDEMILSGTTETRWTGEELEYAGVSAISNPIRPARDVIDISPTSFLLRTVSREESGVISTTMNLENAILSLSSESRFTSPTLASTDLSAALEIGPLHQWLTANLVGLPDLATSGTATLNLVASIDGDTAATDGRVALEPISVISPLVPSGTFEDAPSLDWDVTAAVGRATATGTVSFSTKYADGSFSFEDLGADSGSLTGGGRVMLEPIDAEFVAPFMPEPAAYLAGDMLYAIGVTIESARDFLVTLASESGDGFAIELAQFPIMIDAFSFNQETTIALNDKGMIVEVPSVTFTLQDLLEINANATHEIAGTTQTTRVEARTSASIENTLSWLADTIAQFYPRAIDMMGTVEATTTWTSSFETTEPDDQTTKSLMVILEPFRLENTLTTLIAAGMVETETEILEIENLVDEHTTVFEMSGLDPLVYTVENGQSFSVDYLGFGELFQMESAGLATKVVYTDVGALEFDVPEFKIGAIASRGPTWSVVVPTLNSSARIVGNVADQSYSVEELLASSEGFFNWQNSATTNLENGTVKYKTALTLESLAPLGLELFAEDGSTLPLEMDASGRLNYALEMAYDNSDPEALAIESLKMNATAKEILWSLGFDGMEITGDVESSLDYDHVAMTATVENQAGITMATMPTMTELNGARIDSELSGSLAEGGTLRIDTASLKSDQLGLSLEGYAVVDALMARIESMPAEASNAELLRYFFDTPFEFLAGYDQDLARLAPLAPLSVLNGEISQSVGTINMPREEFELDVEQRSRAVNVAMPDLFSLRGFEGSFPRVFSYRYPGVTPRSGPSQQARYFLEALDLFFPAFTAGIGRLELIMREAGNGYAFVSQSEDFFGGPGNCLFRLEKRGGDPYVYGEFSVTGLDAAKFLPNLERRRVAQREVRCFGSASIAIPRNATVNGLVESLSMRVEITELGVEILREALRMFNADGSNPGIQATLASLRVGRPKSAVMEIRNGLMNMSVRMTTAAGVDFNVPIFEKVGILGFVAPFSTEENDANLRLAREFLLLALSSDMNELLQTLAAE